jgi:hypothetical protein
MSSLERISILIVLLTVPAYGNGSRSFNGSNQYGYNNDPYTGPATYTMSISMWFNPTVVNVSQYMICTADTAVDDDHCGILINSSGTLLLISHETVSQYATGTTKPSATEWHHVVGVWQGSPPYLLMYHDGENDNGSSIRTPVSLDTISLGCRYRSTIDRHFTGYISHVGVWSSALSAANAASLYAGAEPSAVDSGNLVSYWKCEEGSAGDNFTDEQSAWTLTQVNSPGVADGPPIFDPSIIAIIYNRNQQ